MRRARGCGGRFLNTKKLDNDDTSPTSEKRQYSEDLSTKSAHLSGSERISANDTANSNSFHGRHEGNRSLVQELQDAQPLVNGNSNDPVLSSMYNSSSKDAVKSNYFGQQRDIVKGNVGHNMGPHQLNKIHP